MFTSTQKVADLIAEIDEQVSNPYSTPTKVSWINEVEQELYKELIDDYTEHIFTVIDADTDTPIVLSYIDGGETISFIFEDIRKVYIKQGSGIYNEYSPASLAYYVSDYSYYKTNEKLGYSDPKNGDKVKVVFRRSPAMKQAANINTDYLNLPNRFIKIYKYYAFAQILLLKKEYVEANNWINLYNTEIEDFRNWYLEYKPSYGG
jgi:hypothetical protein